MALLRYVSHAEVAVDPAVPVPEWSLSERGRRRTAVLLDQAWMPSIGRIVTSPETKATDTAHILAEHLGITPEVRATTHEIDRSSTGFVAHERHEQLADELFAFPDRRASGWERAVDAQDRIVRALSDLLVPAGPDVVVVGHGGVGTLWFCALTNRTIDRRHDQPGQGHYFTVDTATANVLHAWQPIDDLGPT